MSFLSDIVGLHPQRTLGPIIAQAVLEEKHVDELQVTDHPVEQGAQISDHAFMRPAEVTLQYGWSPSTLSSAIGSINVLSPNLLGGNLQDIYQKLLDLQASRIPFTITTGKRQYENMLIRSISETTNEKTENVLMVTVTCRAIFIVQTQATTLPPKTRQAKPKKTAQTAPKGTKQAVPATPAPGGSVVISTTTLPSR